MTADEFNKERDLSKLDQWFASPEAKAWEAANEVLTRRTFAGLRPVGEGINPNASKSGDPQFDAMMKKIADEK